MAEIYFVPLADNVLLEPIEELNEHGIIVPESSQTNKLVEGRIRKVGLDVKELKEADEVLYWKLTGTEFSHEGKKYRILKEKEILGKFT